MSDISFAPVINALAPLIASAAVAAITGGLAWLAPKIAQALHIPVQKAALDSITAAAQAEAGAIVAATTSNLAHVSITVSNPVIADAASRIVNAMPDALEKAGVTPSQVATLVAGKLGEITAPAAAPPAAG
jgi:hypothetical protein